MYQPLFIDLFDYILIDLHGTIMVGGDRIDDYRMLARTYRSLGGGLEEGRVVEILGDVIPEMWDRYRDLKRAGEFGGLLSFLGEHRSTADLPEEERRLIDRAFGDHELGVIPPQNREVLKHLASVNRLALISDVWSSPEAFLEYLDETDLLPLFDAVVFSSAHGACKPSEKLFRTALELIGAPSPNKALMIGDSYERDIIGARNVGLGTILVAPSRPPEPKCGDRVVGSFDEVLRAR